MVLLLEEETRQGYLHGLVGFGTIRVAILLPVVILLGVCEDFIGLNYELEFVLSSFPIGL